MLLLLPALLIAITLLLTEGSVAQHAHGQHATTEAEVRAGDLVLTRTWTRATPGGARVAGGYLSVRNTGTIPDRLIGGTFEAAGRVEIHEMAMEAGIMRMRNLERGLEIAPGASVELRPGGFHVMFIDLTRPLRQGETVQGTLVFERAGTVNVRFRVDAIGASGGHRH